jgi:DOPA 4,5-dioxygenase
VRDPATITGFHAHIYYTPETRAAAERIRESLGANFTVQIGRWHDKPIGPHPQSMYQVAFAVEEFPRLVPWLMLNRENLSVLIHPLSGNDYDDHAYYASWLGPQLQLNLDFLLGLKS